MAVRSGTEDDVQNYSKLDNTKKIRDKYWKMVEWLGMPIFLTLFFGSCFIYALYSGRDFTDVVTDVFPYAIPVIFIVSIVTNSRKTAKNPYG